MSWEFGPIASAKAIRTAFDSFGFVLIRAVLDSQEVEQVRSELDRGFDKAPLRDMPVMFSTELLRHATAWRCLFKESVVGPLRSALGPELAYQNDSAVQRNLYGQAGLRRHAGWHVDAGSETQHQYLRSAEYRFAKCGIFLQDFDNGWGGGIMVKPKSHRRLCETNALKRQAFFLRRLVDRCAIRLGLDIDTLQVPTRAGDLCFFDSRLLHSSVLPTDANIRMIGYERKPDVGSYWADIPKAHTKYAIYWDACNRAMVDDFLRNSIERAEKTELSGMRESPRVWAAFTRYLSVRYPDDYPPEFVELARSQEVEVASLKSEQAAFYKRKLQSMQLLHP